MFSGICHSSSYGLPAQSDHRRATRTGHGNDGPLGRRARPASVQNRLRQKNSPSEYPPNPAFPVPHPCYCSRSLSRRTGDGAQWQVVLGIVAVGMVVATPLLYSSHRTRYSRNFRVVEEGVLYRSGQLTPEGLDHIVGERGIRTVVSLRTTRVAGRLPPDAWEEQYCAERHLKHVRIVPRVWGADEQGEIPAEEAVKEFLR